jgi:hypothetical protein
MGRGATSGRDAAPVEAPPGIIGRGGNRTGLVPGPPTAEGGLWLGAVFEGGAAGRDDVWTVGGTPVLSGGATAPAGALVTSGADALGAGLGGGDTSLVATGGAAKPSMTAAAKPALPRAAAALSLALTVRTAATEADEFEENSSSIDASLLIVMTPPQTEHRARTALGGTFAGSTRKTERHSGQETFICPPSRSACPDDSALG